MTRHIIERRGVNKEGRRNEHCLGSTHTLYNSRPGLLSSFEYSTMVLISIVQLSDGARVPVRVLGADDQSKPLLIALHGAPGLSDYKEPQSSFGFLASDFRVLVYDARGSGESDLKPPYTHERWVADVDELR